MNALIHVLLPLPLHQTFTYHPPFDGDDVAIGVRVIVPFGSRTLVGIVYALLSSPPLSDENNNGTSSCQAEMPTDYNDTILNKANRSEYTIKRIISVLDTTPIYPQLLLDLAQWMAYMYHTSVGICAHTMLPTAKRERTPPILTPPTHTNHTQQLRLTPQQEHAIYRITHHIHAFYYVYGVTGSGKTAVLLRTAQFVLSQGKSIIYLVPEIALTPQLIEQTQLTLRGNIAIIHSHITPAERLWQWQRIIRGEISIILGVRSAIFAPISNLGLIIIDEEHENSYKSNTAPRYHARQIAMRRCKTEHACLIMASATPSLEAWHAMQTQKLIRIDLPTRVSGSMPSINLVSLPNTNTCISQELQTAITHTYKRGKQSIIFLNRRGFSIILHCTHCQFVMTCQHCSVSLTYHKAKLLMRCHYCGYTTAPIQQCPDCNNTNLSYSGFGTEKVQEELQTLYPLLRIARIDNDTTRKKGALEAILNGFTAGEFDILLGTQMIAKGHNFPHLELVGIIFADAALHIPDFRAAERCFSLIMQVAGRAGRYTNTGQVIIQARDINHTVLQYGLRHDIEGFYASELRTRQELNFPPYRRIIRLVFRSHNHAICDETSKKLTTIIKKNAPSADDILGPNECPIFKQNKNYRFHSLIISTNFAKTQIYLHHILKQVPIPASVYMEIDVDPITIM